MDLENLSGKHVLDAVDFGTKKIKQFDEFYEDAEVCKFRLDGKVYMAIEDPSDGYRSAMEELVESISDVENEFPPHEVVCVHRNKSGYYHCDIMEVIDCITGKVILEVGTDHSDDYYPSFVANFNPQNLAINQE